MLTTKQKQQLKAQAHSLKPVVMLGNHGLSDAVQLAIGEALHTHELIKIRLPAVERDQRQQLIENICQARQADFVQSIGRICVIYRKRPE